MITIAINGFGRIGRAFLRTVLLNAEVQKKLHVVAINIGPAHKEMVAHMFTYDSIMGKYPALVTVEGDELVIENKRIRIISEKEPQLLPWKECKIDWVVESSGQFTDRSSALLHIQAGARNVLITAPAKDEDITIIPGVNDEAFNASIHHIVSLGSCTTNAVVPLLKILDDAFTIQQGYMTTVHAYTNSQVLLDVEREDMRRSRAAALNIIPTATGAMTTIAKVLPHLADRIMATSLRVPVPIVSLIDVTVITKEVITTAAINQTFIDEKQRKSDGILDITMEPLVSSDFIGNAHSVIIDGQLTAVLGKHMGKICGWYDNEWAYSMRLANFLVSIA